MELKTKWTRWEYEDFCLYGVIHIYVDIKTNSRGGILEAAMGVEAEANGGHTRDHIFYVRMGCPDLRGFRWECERKFLDKLLEIYDVPWEDMGIPIAEGKARVWELEVYLNEEITRLKDIKKHRKSDEGAIYECEARIDGLRKMMTEEQLKYLDVNGTEYPVPNKEE